MDDFTPLLDRTLIRYTAQFYSDTSLLDIKKQISDMLVFGGEKIPTSLIGLNINKRQDSVIELTTDFLDYRIAKQVLSKFYDWILFKARTNKKTHFIVDIKFDDTKKGPFIGTMFNTGMTIDKINKFKFILGFNEYLAYKYFPAAKNGNYTKSIYNFKPSQKHIPKKEFVIDPKNYLIPDTTYCGITFETLKEGFIRMKYICGENYANKVSESIELINLFIINSRTSCANEEYTKNMLEKFKTKMTYYEDIREAYFNYSMFLAKFKNIKLTVNLIDNQIVIDSYYPVLRDGIFDILANIHIKEDTELEINYDSTISVFQIRRANISVKTLINIEFIECEIENGKFIGCDFYESKLSNVSLDQCNLFLSTTAKDSKIVNSFCNRTTELENCETSGDNCVLNCKMSTGVIYNAKLGVFAEISPAVKMINHSVLKTGYLVVGDTVVIKSKTYIK